MIQDLIYVFECRNGFKYERTNADEIIRIFDDNVKALEEMKSESDTLYVFIAKSDKLNLKGYIISNIKGVRKHYVLRTEIRKFDERKCDLLALSILTKIAKDRDALYMITCDDARDAIQKEINELNELLKEITSNK